MKKILILIFIMVFSCTGCNKYVAPNLQESSPNIEAEQQGSSTNADPDKSDSSATDEISKANVPQKYIDFIKANTVIESNETIMLYSAEDLNLDGMSETVLVIGVPGEYPSESYVSHIYVLCEDNGKLIQIGEDLAGLGGYGVYEVKLINLQNHPQKYIYCGLTNGGSLLGFSIFEVKENQVELIASSASATGAGEDTLKDLNKDGQYDGYVQNRWSYDVLYIPLNRTFTLQDKEFTMSGLYVEVPEYANNIKDVIIQYLSLTSLDAEQSPEAAKRISELCVETEANQIDYPGSNWYEVMNNTINDFDGGIVFDINENSDSADVTAVIEDNDNNQYEYKFHLLKSNSRWYIDKIN